MTTSRARPSQPYGRYEDQGRGFLGVDTELGVRWGEPEAHNLSPLVTANYPGRLVARAAVVAEWMPRIGNVNKDLGDGLRFAVRGRAWGDVYTAQGGGVRSRLRCFFDAELFYNLSDDLRGFVWYEYGDFPPNFSDRVNRCFVGIGSAF